MDKADVLPMSLRDQVYDVLDVSGPSDHVGRMFGRALAALILMNVAAVVFESVPTIGLQYRAFFRAFEGFSVAIFSIEYLLRLWSCTADPKYSDPILGRLRFAFSAYGLIDLLAVLPFYLPALATVDLRVVRMFRLFRLIRVFKLARYSDSVSLLGRVIYQAREELAIVLFTVFMLLVVLSTLMYSVENVAQPEKFASIPEAMWWGIVTLTTVGYGDIFPVTSAGKVLSGLLALLGIGLFALPTGIISSGFMEELARRRQVVSAVATCPNCGHEL